MMKNSLKFGLVVCSATVFMACLPRNNNSSAGTTELSEVLIKLPAKEAMEQYFGKDCADVKISGDTLKKYTDAKISGCDMVSDLLSVYKLEVIQLRCADSPDSTAKTIIDAIDHRSNSELNFKVKKGCNYSVKLALGESGEKDGIYYDNRFQQQASVDKPMLSVAPNAPDTIDFIVVLEPTEAGLKLGFPATKNSKIASDDKESDSTNVNVNAQFGDRESDNDTAADALNPENKSSKQSASEDSVFESDSL